MTNSLALPSPAVIEAAILRLTAACGAGSSICPSDVARTLLPDPSDKWQSLLGPIRQAATRLAGTGHLEILRKGRPIEAKAPKGVIRLRQPQPAAAA